MPDPSFMAQQQAQQAAQQAQQIHQNHVRQHRHTHDMAHARHTGAPHTHRPLPYAGSRGGGLRGFLTLLVIVAVVVYVAHDPALRASVETFARSLLAHVQSN
jgi:hypothetical protein